MIVAATCYCGCAFEAPMVRGHMVTPHVVCPDCGKDCVVPGVADVPNGVTPMGEGVHHNGQKLPVSMSLPDDNRAGVPDRLYGHEVRRHDDGTFSTVDRRPICHNADAMKKHTERIGWTHERG